MCISKGDERDPPFAEARVRRGYQGSKGNPSRITPGIALLKGPSYSMDP